MPDRFVYPRWYTERELDDIRIDAPGGAEEAYAQAELAELPETQEPEAG